MTAPAGVWPKTVPDLSAAQRHAREQFVREWLEILPRKYSSLERFNHGFVAKLPHSPGCRTLEIGFGFGEHLRYERGDQDYYCLDYREDFCSRVRGLLPADHVCCGDIQETQLQWSDGMFDRIIAIHVLEHLPRLPDALEEVNRLLNNEGVFDVVIPCEGGLAYSLARKISAERMFRRRFKMDYGPIIRSEHVNTHAEIVSALEDSFRVNRARFFPTFVPFVDLNLVSAYRFTKRNSSISRGRTHS